MRRLDRRVNRRGAVTLEAAIVIPIFLLIVLGMIDLGIGVFRQATLSQAARVAARKAAVHGKMAPAGWEGGKWGTTPIDQYLTASGVPVVNAVKPILSHCPQSETRIRVEWPDGNNEVGDRVLVKVTSPYRPIMTFIFGNPSITLSASSTVLISH
jgi:Flp pilus assembly protein TadG